jgi:hypothetical protein
MYEEERVGAKKLISTPENLKSIKEHFEFDEFFAITDTDEDRHPIMIHNISTMRSKSGFDKPVNRIFGRPGKDEVRFVTFADDTFEKLSAKEYFQIWAKAIGWRHEPVYIEWG